MIALIVDDEEHVREGIELAVDWEAFGIRERLTAEDGRQALELVRMYKPVVVFCDMHMPGMDGKELLQRLRDEGWDTQVIIISGFSDIDYTRAALRAGGVDYIPKPFTKKEVESALAKAIEIWREKETSKIEERETEHQLKVADGMMDEKRLAAYLRGDSKFSPYMHTLLAKVGLPKDNLTAIMILPRNRLELIDLRFMGDTELFVFAINNIAHESLSRVGPHYLCRLDEYQWLLLLSSERNGNLRNVMDHLKKDWSQILGFNVLAGIPQSWGSVEQLEGVIGEAKKELLKCNILPSTGKSPMSESTKEEYLMDRYLLLDTAVKTANKTMVSQVVHSFCELLRERGSLSLKELQAYTMEANVMLGRASRAADIGGTFDLYMPLWISDVNEWEQTFIQQWWLLIEQLEPDVSGGVNIQAIREYLHEAYSEDISLTSLSEKFHFSPQYIAKKFKELYETTVMTYLTEIRLEKAKSLLRFTDMTVTAISYAVGYQDENYFGRVFKKMTGLSPVQYRKHRNS